MNKAGYALTNAAFVTIYIAGVGFLWAGLRQLIFAADGPRASVLPITVGFCILMTLSMAEWILRSTRLGASS